VTIEAVDQPLTILSRFTHSPTTTHIWWMSTVWMRGAIYHHYNAIPSTLWCVSHATTVAVGDDDILTCAGVVIC
jgi:hypothetical protein